MPPDPRGPPGVYVQLAKFVTWIAEQMEYVESMKESLSCMSASNITNDADDLAAGCETTEALVSELILVPVGETSGDLTRHEIFVRGPSTEGIDQISNSINDQVNAEEDGGADTALHYAQGVGLARSSDNNYHHTLYISDKCAELFNA